MVTPVIEIIIATENEIPSITRNARLLRREMELRATFISFIEITHFKGTHFSRRRGIKAFKMLKYSYLLYV